MSFHQEPKSSFVYPKKKGINLHKSTSRICEIQKQAGMRVEGQLEVSGESKNTNQTQNQYHFVSFTVSN